MNEEKRTIEDYKKALIDILQEMENEHGCKVKSVSIEAVLFEGWPLYDHRRFDVNIEL